MATGEEFWFRIDAFSPDSIPLERLAEYLADLAVLLGETKSVHLVRIEAGSVVPVLKVEQEAAPKVRDRARKIAWGAGPAEALRAYRKINERLRNDNAVGVLQEPTGGEIIRFPGREGDAEEDIVVIRQQGNIDGEVIRIGGRITPVPVTLQSEDQTFSYCFASRPVAKEMGHRLFEPVRLFGTGRWTRNRQGAWELDQFIIDRFEVLRDEPLSSVLTELRTVPGGDWDAGAIRELLDLRHEGDEAR